MSLYSTLRYIRYRWKAKGRHGIHSPFVYEMVDDILSREGTIDDKIARIVAGKKVHHISGDSTTWASKWISIKEELSEDDIVLLKNIHTDSGSDNVWQTIVADRDVRLSIDLFYYGLLFFKKDFHEKQHFILRH